MGAWVGVVAGWWTGCAEEPPKPPADEDTGGGHSGVGSTTTEDTGPVEYVPELPTDVSEACWAWGVERDAVGYSAEYLRFYDPGTLDPTYAADDYEPDGHPDRVDAYGYAGGDLVWRTLDDGSPPVNERWAYEYVDGKLALATVDEGDDGALDRWYRYAYDAAGRVEAVAVDVGDDGVVDSTYVFTYVDATGPDLTLVVDLDLDGLPDVIRSEVHDAAGRLVQAIEEAPGVSSHTFTNTYASPAPSLDVARVDGEVSDAQFGDYTYRIDRDFGAPGQVATERATYELGGPPLVFDTEWVWTCP